MSKNSSMAIERFKNLVGIKFQLYNGLFTSLPFHRIEKTGILLSLFLSVCEDGFKNNKNPKQIIESFFSKHTSNLSEKEKLDLLFGFIQYAERQVVLFDALEDASFGEVNDMFGVGTLKHLETEISEKGLQKKFDEKIKNFCVSLVLTAHPTQFYPGPVLSIINDLSKALTTNNSGQVNLLLQQLGKTPFLKHKKPTPYDEAISLIWYLENVFYNAVGNITTFFRNRISVKNINHNKIFKMGFWPGGDRDGNPFVRAGTTLQVADALRGSIIKCYYLEIRRLKRRLTFEGVDILLADLEKKLYNNIFVMGQKTNIKKSDIIKTLDEIIKILINKHNGLFLHLVENLKNKVETFGLHFASLDLRQDSSIHTSIYKSLSGKILGFPKNYIVLNPDEKIKILSSLKPIDNNFVLENEIEQDTLEVIKSIKLIQHYNGVEGCCRYIVSQCHSAVDVMELYGLFLLAGWESEKMEIDFIPLFETIDDLQNASSIMKNIYSNQIYRNHLKRRKNCQTIMLGFSDGTKDGGYMMANWSIYKAKEEVAKISKQFGIEIIFFDGRGGPPARGGGKTHKFYTSLDKNISGKEIQLTVQGQTVSSNFGTIDSAQFNIEQLIHAGITNELSGNKSNNLNLKEKQILQKLAEYSFVYYSKLKNHKNFIDYLVNTSPLKFYSDTNIGSRPTKRGSGVKLNLENLRAIPFVGAWSQLKQNVTGYYGVGSALKKIEKDGQFSEIKSLYNKSLFFKTLLDNCEMSMMKSFFSLTSHLEHHKKYGEIWKMIFSEYELTKKYLFQLSGKNQLMAEYPIEQQSIKMRERIVLPLLTIQQFALMSVSEIEKNKSNKTKINVLEKLVMRCSFGIINAGRNSA